MSSQTFLVLVCALSFLGYGISCLSSPHMAIEFQRYGLAGFRRITGILQLLAAIGLTIGLFLPWVGGIAAAGLALQMACGLAVRLKIGDPWYLCFPAGSYMLLCGWLAFRLL